jgi:DNA-directed RNA polymerase subunit M/transcription elongation factor TFIIS
LMYTTGKNTDQKNIDQLPKIVKNITHVASIPKEILYCKNCKKDKLISYIREKHDMTRIFVCTCGHYWRDS